jgi:hypothetical protein
MTKLANAYATTIQAQWDASLKEQHRMTRTKTKTTTLHIHLTAEAKRLLKALADDQGLTMTDVIEMIVRDEAKRKRIT